MTPQARVALLGLPRSGTTWTASLLSAHPSIHLVNEPDNRDFGDLAWIGTARTGPNPMLSPGEPAPDYRLMWRIAFAGGFPAGGWLGRSTRLLRRVSSNPSLPLAVRSRALRTAGQLAALRRPPAPVVVVKSVRSPFTADWLIEAFDPALLVLWRHPLNVVSGWVQHDWHGTHLHDADPVRARFEQTAAWPPPTDVTGATAWSVCATSTLLLEAAERRAGALVMNHEQNSEDPSAAAMTIFNWLGLRLTPEVPAFIVANDRPGQGFDIQRRSAEETGRWRARLGSDDVRTVMTIVELFQSASTAAAAAWPRSPAVAS